MKENPAFITPPHTLYLYPHEDETIDKFCHRLMFALYAPYCICAIGHYNGVRIMADGNSTLQGLVQGYFTEVNQRHVNNKRLKGANKMNEKNLKKNAEGYSDPTAYQAIKNADNDIEAARVKKLLGAIFRICELSGYHVENRLELKNLETGKIWR